MNKPESTNSAALASASDMAFPSDQNLWLAARAEGLGVGWVSLFDPVAVAALLNMPAGAEPIALLCIGPVHAFYEEPMLQRERWAKRCPLDDLIFEDTWGEPLAHPAVDVGFPLGPQPD